MTREYSASYHVVTPVEVRMRLIIGRFKRHTGFLTEQNSSKTPSSKSPCLISGRFNTVVFLHDRVTPICLIRGRPFLNNLGPLRLPQLTQDVIDCRCDSRSALLGVARSLRIGQRIPWAGENRFGLSAGRGTPFRRCGWVGLIFFYRLGGSDPPQP